MSAALPLQWTGFRLLCLCLLCSAGGLQAKTLNGFDLRGASVPASQIQQGGPPRDGIPAISRPRFESAGDAAWLTPQAKVLGLHIDGESRAYPVDILNWHELVNDVLAEQGVLVSYCPLCGTGMAFRSEVDGQHLEFGVSGLLYNSDVLFYDRQTESLWSQIKREAISGPWRSRQLEQLPMQHTTWQHWRDAHPNTLVLSRDQGFARDYTDDPYAGYEKTRRLFFKVAGKIGREFHPKERVLGLLDGEEAMAIPFTELRKQGLPRFEISFAENPVTIVWDADSNTATALTANGETRVHTVAFWFAWSAFHPGTAIFRAP